MRSDSDDTLPGLTLRELPNPKGYPEGTTLDATWKIIGGAWRHISEWPEAIAPAPRVKPPS